MLSNGINNIFSEFKSYEAFIYILRDSTLSKVMPRNPRGMFGLP